MKELVEMIAKRNGISTIDVWNQYQAIDNNIGELCKSDYKESLEDLILNSIQYSISLKNKMEYKNFLNYVISKCN